MILFGFFLIKHLFFFADNDELGNASGESGAVVFGVDRGGEQNQGWHVQPLKGILTEKQNESRSQ